MRFGQRIRAFHLNRVLRGEDEERFLQRVADSGGRDLMLLHCFEQRGLGLGRRAIDFIGEDDVGEDRASNELQLASSRRAIFFDDVGAGDVGRHQVGRELNPLE